MADDTPAPSHAESQLNRLRDALLGEHYEKLKAIEARLADQEYFMSQLTTVLPEGVAASDTHSPKLSFALRDPAVKTLSLAARTRTADLSLALAPVMGPAISRAITVALRDFQAGMEHLIANNFTATGLRWRWMSWRTGVPVARIAMQETIRSQSEHVLFASKRTGAILASVVSNDLGEDIPPTVVAEHRALVEKLALTPTMTRIASEVQSVKVGDRTIVLAHGPWATIGAVVYGEVPNGYQQQVLTALQAVEKEFVNELKNLKPNSNVSAFSAADPTLQGLLVQDFLAPKKNVPVEPVAAKPSRWKLWLALVLLALLIWIAYSVYSAMIRRSLTHALEAETALVTTHIDGRPGAWLVRGLADPMAFSAERVATTSGVPVSQVQYELRPYISLDPALMLQRAKAKLNPPPDITLSIVGNRLLVGEGIAPVEWIERARQAALTIPGIENVDFSKVKMIEPKPLVPSYTQPLAALQAIEVVFASGCEVAPAELAKLDAAAAHLQELLRIATLRNETPQILVEGHTTDSSSAPINAQLGLARAEALASALQTRGVPPALTVARAAVNSNGRKVGTFQFSTKGR